MNGREEERKRERKKERKKETNKQSKNKWMNEWMKTFIVILLFSILKLQMINKTGIINETETVTFFHIAIA